MAGRQAVDQLEVRILNLGEGERKQSRNKLKNNCGVAPAQRQIRRMKGGERREELQQSIRALCAFLLPPAPHFVCSHFWFRLLKSKKNISSFMNVQGFIGWRGVGRHVFCPRQRCYNFVQEVEWNRKEAFHLENHIEISATQHATTTAGVLPSKIFLIHHLFSGRSL